MLAYSVRMAWYDILVHGYARGHDTWKDTLVLGPCIVDDR